MVVLLSAQNNNSGRFTLQQCIETGMVNNLDVLQSELQTQAEEIIRKQAKLTSSGSGCIPVMGLMQAAVLISSLMPISMRTINYHYFPW